MTKLVLGLIVAYQRWLSPTFAPPCRYQPTCSHYASEAVRRFGWRRGGWLALRRLARCTPWGSFGYDPVPSPARGEEDVCSVCVAGDTRVHRPLASSLRRAGAWWSLALVVALVLGACVPGRQRPVGGWSGPEPVGSAVYVGTMEGRLLALEVKPEARAKLWEFPPAGQKELEAIYTSPLVVQGRAYFGDFEGKVHALDASSGDQVWEFDMGAPVFAGLAQGDSVVVAASAGGRVVALSAETGEPRWSFDGARDGVWATPAVAGGTVFVASLDHFLYALDLGSGQRRWTFEARGALAAEPLVSGDLVYQGSFGQRLYALNARDGRLVWEFAGDGWFWGRPVVVDGTLYAPSLGRRLYALDATTGAQKWAFDAKAPLRSSAVVAGDTVVVATEKGDVYAVHRLTGVQRWSTKAGANVVAPLSASGETVYVYALDHTIYAFSVRNGQKLWSWNTSVSEK
ncbi:MAG: membrane protein insertion efficiency factor YidD [Chloroflexi bacterium]|nr:membrane protein insertion efficiency factor YidD [Chloroflexota bacterium]